MHSRIDVAQVGGVAARLLGSADGDEVHARVGGGRDVGREPETAVAGAEQVVETRLEEGRTAGGQIGDLRASTSMPTTSWPSSAMQAACTAPRYPQPITEIRTGRAYRCARGPERAGPGQP